MCFVFLHDFIPERRSFTAKMMVPHFWALIPKRIQRLFCCPAAHFSSTTVTPSSQARAVPAGTACAFARRAFRGGTSSPRSPPLRSPRGRGVLVFGTLFQFHHGHAVLAGAGGPCGDRLRVRAPRLPGGNQFPPEPPPPLSEGTRGFDIRNVISIPPRSRRLPPRRSGRVGRLSHSGCA